ncbi:MAG: leucine--tRNA ligase [Candidatus Moranbacteria bacterium]|nr:leucine--tRNA ligase [Candidatus Moranbacteria bacterium]
MKKAYEPKKIEGKWQKYWNTNGTYRQYKRPKKQYVLDMFPYPSGAGLHVGHPKGYIASDVYSRFKQLQGYGVLHPMGWDAFGLPAEQYAIKNNVHPEVAVKKNIATFKKQLEKIGFTYDWEREINTTDPEYYKWTQWIFLQMFHKGLAYQSFDPINWCPSCQTGLANEDLEQGRCERCDSIVEKRPMRQWVLKITAYADKMLRDLSKLDWPDGVKEAQKNWIGRSEGVEVTFYVVDTEEEVRVFTTRLDTIYGCTYVVVAPEHPLVEKLASQVKNLSEVKKYLVATKKKTDLERTELNKEKTGVCLEGIEVAHPFTGERLPVYIADYVLATYGTGAVMGVPAHDERDGVFAKKYQLEVRESVRGKEASIDGKPFTDDGILVDSKEFSGLTSEEAREKMTAWLKKEKIGKKVVNYKMRDWVFSRQRYWGEPIPIIHCEKCGVVPVPEKDLPVKLPKVKAYQPAGTGESPLATISSWVNVKCPKCKGSAKRETNTMPQWAGSSWYYLRFIDPANKKALVDKKKEKKMMPVDVYVGGDHATRHLIYARFWHKFLYDQKIVSTPEPFTRLEFLGLILASDGRKMSKRWGNVINPDDVVAQFGADAFRLYEMFMGPFTQSIAWNTDGVVGTRRFLEKVWKLHGKITKTSEKKIESLLHQTIKKVTEDIEAFKFNTAISSLMILVNEMEKAEKLSVEHYKTLLVLISSFAPHIAEELWAQLGEKKSIFLASWPKYDAKKIVAESVNVAVQVNGKVRTVLAIATGTSEEYVKSQALADSNVQTHIAGKTVRKVIYIPGKIVSIVVG